jgi:hypothetical protein
MNYKPGDKVQITVKGVTWDDVVKARRYKKNKIIGYYLESKMIAPPDCIVQKKTFYIQ